MASPPMQADRVEKNHGDADPGALVRALQQHAQSFAAAATATVSRGLQAASKAPEVLDGATTRMAGLAGVVLSMPGDVPHDAAHGYGPQASSSTATHGPAATTLEKRIPFTATSIEGGHALTDVKSNCEPDDFKSFGSADALRNAMRTPVGHEVHHLVEQNQTTRFGTQAIQNTRNAINLPKVLHTEVGRLYSRRPALAAQKAGFNTYRGYIQSLPYAEQRAEGIQTVRDAIKSLNMVDPVFEDQLKVLDNDPCFTGNSK